jgi:uncharacterized protein (DUF1499 family)
MMLRKSVVGLIVATWGVASALVEPVNRRQALISAAASVVTFLPGPPANAFANKVSNKYDDRPKRRGPKPQDLGVATRTTFDGIDDYMGLKTCGVAPNCFSSTIPDDEDHSIPAWTWPKDFDQTKAFEQLKEVIESYPPGQANVDGGGFQIQSFDASKGYMYVQFEALKNGYIDDVEFAAIKELGEGKLQVRSSSRIGYLDYGVNAKRLNWIAEALRAKGWKAVGVDFATHKFYAAENQER